MHFLAVYIFSEISSLTIWQRRSPENLAHHGAAEEASRGVDAGWEDRDLAKICSELCTSLIYQMECTE